MNIFTAIFFGVPVVTLVWWAWADRRLRALGRAASGSGERTGGWSLGRGVLAGFVVAFLLGYAWLVAGRIWPETLIAVGIARVPHPWLMALLMLWALIVLPLVVIPSMVAWILWQAVDGVRHFARRWYGYPWARRRASRRDAATGHFARRWYGYPLARPNGEPFDPTSDTSETTVTRRQMLATTLLTTPVWTTFGLTGIALVQKRHFRIREFVVDVPQLPAALDGLTIAHVSDTHVGKFTRGEVLDRIADATNDLAADLVLLTGDLIDHSLHDLPEALRMLDRIDRRSGLFMIEGNHDLFDGRAAFADRVRAAGVPLLLNESERVRVRGHAVQVMGVPWQRDSQSIARDVDRVAAQRDPEAFPILLAHHPHAFDRAAEVDLPLTLAGHTHGGQLMLTPEWGAGPAIFKYWSGLYERGASRLLVSNGAGNWFPLRTSAPAEILHVTLKRSGAGRS